ncbi:NAD(P)-dependent oxidoreductase [Sinorhizobium sp. BG8]|uniref:NAD-dependent epimerase/dehydratase family protein n=1 Tax=Sinorhizobium sp. BG8 TaxID=2613773 RepID=UPI00193CA3E0|nr:NAD(P)-dependent oxidoreductase [Sinorhizobium sp. BG8]QRM56594.1 NAD(P)-dependent oxidoreductase [Sinorhizobium sp. BG8]
MTRVLVSGGSGYVGRFIVEHLAAHGYKVTSAGRTPASSGHFTGDVAYVPLHLDPDLDQSHAFHDVDCFVHAGFAHIPGKYRGGEGDDPEAFRRANLEGSVRLFEQALRAGVRRCVFLSSRAVYGRQAAGIALTEDMTPQPDTLYGSVKLDAERSLHALSGRGFATASLRVTGVYGQAAPGSRHKWETLISDYLAGRPVAARAGTEVHGADVAEAVRLMLGTDAARISDESFNVSDILVDTRAILAPVMKESASLQALPPRADGQGVNVMSTDKIRTLGWAPGGWPRFEEYARDLAARFRA